MPAIGVPAPKKGSGIRPLVVAPIESRIVQRAIHDVLRDVPSIRQYTENPFSFGGVRKKHGNELGAVPAAIQAAVEAIRNGATHVVRSDISAFFTKIPKPAVTAIVAAAMQQPDFVELFTKAIAVELENLAALRERISEFPIHEIGVAQGNSLSPLLGNLLLRDFDIEMNVGPSRCLRYIDDFLILAPDRATADREFSRARNLLSKYNLEVSIEKTDRGDTTQGFVFLGIELGNGAIRPSKDSRKRLLSNISEILDDGASAMRAHRKTGKINPAFSLIRTLNEVKGVVQGWGSHYSFCNEKNIFAQLDNALTSLLRGYLGRYSREIERANAKGRRHLLGVPLLEELACHPFSWAQPSTTPSIFQSYKANASPEPDNPATADS
ncbi:MAG TPA: reverse transcriptase domain-containing protein [Candidatus Acidoferrum sp.]|nr:reverse transcriptase domain-containing protein [Candidatus Acidoferrum sp.]